MTAVSSNPEDLEQGECSTGENQPLLFGQHIPSSANSSAKIYNEEGPRLKIPAKTNCFERIKKKEAMKRFYSEQNELLELYHQDDAAINGTDREQHIKNCDAESNRKMRIDRRLASFIFVMNVCLLAGNLTAAIMSGSYSVISSLVVYASIWAINNTNMFNYPRGRQRLEVVAVIICSVIMGVANVMVIVTSVQAIIANTVNPDANFITVSILLGGIFTKSIAMFFCYRHGTSNAQVLALDQRNDVITCIVALGGAYVGDHFWLYADPAGAILVCTFIAVSWFSNAFENIPLIVGRAGEKEHVSRILRLAIEHDERVKFIDHLMVYHIGEKALVELHVVLDEHLPLKVTHDLTEALEQKIKALDFVERVFVHVDYRCDGDFDGV